MSYIGAHSHVHDDDVLESLKRACDNGSTAVQIYLGNKQKTTLKYKYPISSKDSKEIKSVLKKCGMKLFVHGNLTLNLSRPTVDSKRYKWMLDNVIYDMKTCSKIGGKGVVVHIGSTAGELSIKEGTSNMIKSIQYIIENSPTNVNIIIENTAGEGSSIGSELEKLHEIYIAIPLELRKRVKICIDTCHAFSAGYDIRSCGGVKIFFEKLDKLFGLRGNIVLIHINDSVYVLGSHKDRHASIYEGHIFNKKLGGNPDALVYLIEYAVHYDIPMVLETRNIDSHRKEIKMLKKIVKEGQTIGYKCLMTGGSGNKRDQLSDIFNQLHKIYESMGDTHRSRSYQRLSKIIANANHSIKSMSDLKGINGITDKSLMKIKQILETGHLDILDELKSDHKASVELTGVIGIGPEAARRLLGKGITNISQLRHAFKENKVKLNSDQQLGLKYYNDFAKKVSRKDAERYRDELCSIIERKYPGTKLELAGSYRMGKKQLKDIDLLVIIPNENNIRGESMYIEGIVDELESAGMLKDVFHKGDIQLMAAMRLGRGKTRHVDLRLIPKRLLPFYRLHFGSGMDFSRKIKLSAKRQGYKLSEYGLYDLRKKVYIKGLRTEKDIFKALGESFVLPKDRL